MQTGFFYKIGKLVWLYEDNISGKLTDERFHKPSTDYEAEQAGLQEQAAILHGEIEEAEGKSANVDRFLSVIRQYTDIPELTPRILYEFVEKIVIHAATDPHSKINHRQEVDIYYKGIGILEMLIAGKNERNGIAEAIPFLSRLRMFS